MVMVFINMMICSIKAVQILHSSVSNVVYCLRYFCFGFEKKIHDLSLFKIVSKKYLGDYRLQGNAFKNKIYRPTPDTLHLFTLYMYVSHAIASFLL